MLLWFPIICKHASLIPLTRLLRFPIMPLLPKHDLTPFSRIQNMHLRMSPSFSTNPSLCNSSLVVCLQQPLFSTHTMLDDHRRHQQRFSLAFSTINRLRPIPRLFSPNLWVYLGMCSRIRMILNPFSPHTRCSTIIASINNDFSSSSPPLTVFALYRLLLTEHVSLFGFVSLQINGVCPWRWYLLYFSLFHRSFYKCSCSTSLILMIIMFYEKIKADR